MYDFFFKVMNFAGPALVPPQGNTQFNVVFGLHYLFVITKVPNIFTPNLEVLDS